MSSFLRAFEGDWSSFCCSLSELESGLCGLYFLAKVGSAYWNTVAPRVPFWGGRSISLVTSRKQALLAQ